jgi:hypothetical protein
MTPSGRLVGKFSVGAESDREVVPLSSSEPSGRTNFLGKEEVSSSNLDVGSTTLLEFKSGLDVFLQPVEEVFRLHGGRATTRRHPGTQLSVRARKSRQGLGRRGQGHTASLDPPWRTRTAPPLRHIFIPRCDVKGVQPLSGGRRHAAIPRPVSNQLLDTGGRRAP